MPKDQSLPNTPSGKKYDIDAYYRKMNDLMYIHFPCNTNKFNGIFRRQQELNEIPFDKMESSRFTPSLNPLTPSLNQQAPSFNPFAASLHQALNLFNLPLMSTRVMHLI